MWTPSSCQWYRLLSQQWKFSPEQRIHESFSHHADLSHCHYCQVFHASLYVIELAGIKSQRESLTHSGFYEMSHLIFFSYHCCPSYFPFARHNYLLPPAFIAYFWSNMLGRNGNIRRRSWRRQVIALSTAITDSMTYLLCFHWCGYNHTGLWINAKISGEDCSHERQVYSTVKNALKLESFSSCRIQHWLSKVPNDLLHTEKKALIMQCSKTSGNEVVILRSPQHLFPWGTFCTLNLLDWWILIELYLETMQNIFQRIQTLGELNTRWRQEHVKRNWNQVCTVWVRHRYRTLNESYI